MRMCPEGARVMEAENASGRKKINCSIGKTGHVLATRLYIDERTGGKSRVRHYCFCPAHTPCSPLPSPDISDRHRCYNGQPKPRGVLLYVYRHIYNNFHDIYIMHQTQLCVFHDVFATVHAVLLLPKSVRSVEVCTTTPSCIRI